MSKINFLPEGWLECVPCRLTFARRGPAIDHLMEKHNTTKTDAFRLTNRYEAERELRRMTGYARRGSR